MQSFRKNDKGQNLFIRTWPVEQPKAAIALVHGQGEHIDRYAHLAKYMNDRGIAVVGYDQIGHGHSDGKRGHAESLNALFQDVVDHVNSVRMQYPDIPVIVYGHSMGGHLVLNAALRGLLPVDLAGLIATGPWVRLAFEQPAIKILMGKLMRSILPGLTLPNGLNANWISLDPAVVEAYAKDPLVHNKISAACGIALMEGADYLNKYAGEVPFPFLIMHGGSDKITSMPASQELASRLKGPVQHKVWDGLYHEIHNEKAQDQVFETIYSWMTK